MYLAHDKRMAMGIGYPSQTQIYFVSKYLHAPATVYFPSMRNNAADLGGCVVSRRVYIDGPVFWGGFSPDDSICESRIFEFQWKKCRPNVAKRVDTAIGLYSKSRILNNDFYHLEYVKYNVLSDPRRIRTHCVPVLKTQLKKM